MPKGRPSIHYETSSTILNDNCSTCEFEDDILWDSDVYEEYSELEINNSNNLLLTDNLQIPKFVNNAPIHLINFAHRKNYSFMAFLVILPIIGCIFNVFQSNSIQLAPITAEQLYVKFPSQLQYTWVAVISGIEEVATCDEPSMFLFLYEKEAKKTVEYFLSDIAKYASRTLKKKLPPIMLTNADLNTVRARTDDGYLIEKYKPILEERGVMIIKNLDKISGQTAQALHSMFDEHSPLVSESVVFFTMQVDNLKTSYKTDVQLVEDILRKNWDDLDDDIFLSFILKNN